MSNLKKVACLLLAGMLTSQSVTVDGGVQTAKAEEATVPETSATETPAPVEVFEIATAKDLDDFVKKVNAGESFSGKKVQLTDDIAFDGVTINNFQSITSTFKGEFDGAGHKISGIIIMTKSSGCLFTNISNAKIHDLTLENCEFNASDAAVVGTAENSQIYNCKLLNCKMNGTGGLVGKSTNTDIYGCTMNNCKMEGSYTAGIVSDAKSTNVYNCTLEGCVVEGSWGAAGLIWNAESCEIRNCKNNSKVNSTNVSAGLIGKAHACVLNNDINMGSVNVEQVNTTNGTNYSCAAGLVGTLSGSSSINNCANQADISGQYSEVDAFYYYDFDPDEINSYIDDDDDDEDLSDCYNLSPFHKMQQASGTVNSLYYDEDGDYYTTSTPRPTNTPTPTSTPEPKTYSMNVGGLVGEIYEATDYDLEDNVYEKYTPNTYIQNCYHTGKVTVAANESEKTGMKGEYKELDEIIGKIHSNGQCSRWGVLTENPYVEINVILSNCFMAKVDEKSTKTGVYEGSCASRNIFVQDVEEMKTATFLNTLNHNRGVNKDWTQWELTDTYPTHKQAYPLLVNGKLKNVYEQDAEITFTITPNEAETTTVAPTVNDGKESVLNQGNNVYSFLMPRGIADITYTGKSITLSAELTDAPNATERPAATMTPSPTPIVTATPVSTPTAAVENTAVPTIPTSNEPGTPTTVSPTEPTIAPTAAVVKEPEVDPINKALTLYVGGNTQNTKSYQLKVTNVTDYEISYESDNTSVATVSAKGKITAKKAGTAVIYAHVKDKTSGKSYPFVLANVTVKKAGLSFSKKVTSLKVKKTATFKVKKNGIKGTVKWSVSNKKLASITSKGVLKAKKAGKVKVTAACGNKKATVSVTIKK